MDEQLVWMNKEHVEWAMVFSNGLISWGWSTVDVKHLASAPHNSLSSFCSLTPVLYPDANSHRSAQSRIVRTKPQMFV